MPDQEFSQLQIDCGAGAAVEMLLDETEAVPIRQLREQAERQRAEQDAVSAALGRLRFAAVSDQVLADLLTVFGPGEGA
jgi:hypothetical protein